MRRGDIHSDEEPKGKKKKMMPMLQKLEVLDKLDRGMKCYYCYYSVNEWLICFIKKYEHGFVGSIKTSAALIAKILCMHYMISSLQRKEGPHVYGWKIGTSRVVSHWCCGKEDSLHASRG